MRCNPFGVNSRDREGTRNAGRSREPRGPRASAPHCFGWWKPLAAVYGVRSADPDLWGHLRYGKHIFENGGRVGPDPFAYTTAGRVWNDHEYVAQMVLWLAYDAGGPVGLILLKCAVGALTMFLLVRAVRLGSDDPRVWLPLSVVLAMGLGRWLLFRPQIFSFLLLGCVRAGAVPAPARLRRPGARLWLLPVLTACWVNLHGGFLAGIGVVGLALALRIVQGAFRHGLRPRQLFAETLPLALTLAMCFAGSLLNPLGWRLWPYVRTELGFKENRLYIGEWEPIWKVWNLWLELVPFFLVLAVLVYTAVLAWRKASSHRGSAGLGLVAQLRAADGDGVSVEPAHTHTANLGGAGRRPARGRCARRAEPRLGYRLAQLHRARRARRPASDCSCASRRATAASLLGHPRSPRTRPDHAAAFLKVNGLKGNVYTPLWWGSYLTWELYPDILVSIDGRNVTLFAAETVTDNFRFYAGAQPDVDIPSRLATDYLLVPGRRAHPGTTNASSSPGSRRRRWLGASGALMGAGDANYGCIKSCNIRYVRPAYRRCRR